MDVRRGVDIARCLDSPEEGSHRSIFGAQDLVKLGLEEIS